MTPTEAVTEMLANGDYDSLTVEQVRGQYYVRLHTFSPDLADLACWASSLDEAIAELYTEWRDTMKEPTND